MKSYIPLTTQRLYRVLLIAPTISFGTIGVVILVQGLLAGAGSYEFLWALVGFTLKWLWVSVPFFILLQQRCSAFHVLCLLIVYAIYAYAVSRFVAHSGNIPLIEEIRMIKIYPFMATLVVGALLVIEMVIDRDLWIFKKSLREAAKSSLAIVFVKEYYRVFLLMPIVLLGLTEGIAIFRTSLSSEGQGLIVNYARLIADFIFLWLWTSTPFVILLRKQSNLFHISIMSTVYIVYIFGIYLLIANAEKDTMVASGMLMLGVPLVATLMIVISLIIEHIIIKIVK